MGPQAADETEAMTPVPSHRNRTIEKVGVVVMIAGAVAALLPARPADGLENVHEIVVMYSHHWWWWFGGIVSIVIGNTLRLIGLQGHPGLPWPLWGGIDHALLVRLSVRRRILFHRRHPRASLRRRYAAAAR